MQIPYARKQDEGIERVLDLCGPNPGVFWMRKSNSLLIALEDPPGPWNPSIAASGSWMISSCSEPSSRVWAFVFGQCSARNCFMGILRMWAGNFKRSNWNWVVTLAMWPSRMARMAVVRASTANHTSQLWATERINVFIKVFHCMHKQITLMLSKCAEYSHSHTLTMGHSSKHFQFIRDSQFDTNQICIGTHGCCSCLHCQSPLKCSFMTEFLKYEQLALRLWKCAVCTYSKGGTMGHSSKHFQCSWDTLFDTNRICMAQIAVVLPHTTNHTSQFWERQKQ